MSSLPTQLANPTTHHPIRTVRCPHSSSTNKYRKCKCRKNMARICVRAHVTRQSKCGMWPLCNVCTHSLATTIGSVRYNSIPVASTCWLAVMTRLCARGTCAPNATTRRSRPTRTLWPRWICTGMHRMYAQRVSIRLSNYGSVDRLRCGHMWNPYRSHSQKKIFWFSVCFFFIFSKILLNFKMKFCKKTTKTTIFECESRQMQETAFPICLGRQWNGLIEWLWVCVALNPKVLTDTVCKALN